MGLSVADNLKREAALSNATDSPRIDLEVLLAHVLGRTRTWLYTWPEHVLSDADQTAFDALVNARSQGEPVAYLTGVREFWSLPLKTSSSTLIPRPDTELLVEQALQLWPADKPCRLLDLGTGTGAIALALASERPLWSITAVDRIPEACELARDNARALGLPLNVLQSNWFTALNPAELFDVIISNPPYIDAADPHLHQGDVRFEPHSALVAGAKGLADIRLIATGAGGYLASGGWLLVEHGWQQADSVRAIFIEAGFIAVSSCLDLSGHERVTLGKKP